MLQDKELVNDYLTGLNASLGNYAMIINETNDTQLRQTIIGLRNQDESRQRTVYNYALQKGYYKPSFPEAPEKIQQLKQDLTAGQ